MYAGRVVEQAPTVRLFAARRVYAKALLGSLPGPEVRHRAQLAQDTGSSPRPDHVAARMSGSGHAVPHVRPLCRGGAAPSGPRRRQLRGLLEGAERMALALRTVDLVKVYPMRRGPAVQAFARCLGGARVGSDSGHRGGERVRQVHTHATAGRPGRTKLGDHRAFRRGDPAGRCDRAAAAACSSCSRIRTRSLDPRLTVATAIGEVLKVHGLARRGPERESRIAELLGMVALADASPTSILTSFRVARRSVSPSPGRSRSSQGRSSWTNRRRPSTFRCGPR